MKWLKDYFDLGKKEQAGFITLLCIIFFLFGLQFFIIYFVPAKKTDFSSLQKIAQQLQSGKVDSASADSGKSIVYPGPKKALTSPVDINTADSIKLMTVKGIGPTFAGRILAFRRKVGCFVEVDQLQDVHGIGASKYEYLKPQVCLSKGHPKRLNINTATVDGLEENPYINHTLANDIIKYRINHGRYSSVDDLKKAIAIDEMNYAKILPYITVK